MRKRALFGPGGNSESFHAAGYKSTIQAPEWVKKFGLDAYEYEAGNGLTASLSTLAKIGEEARINDIHMSLHSPYYISLSSVEPEKRVKSVEYIMQCADAAEALGARTIVIHTGSAAKITRELATEYAKDTISAALTLLGDRPVTLGLETMGKLNQLGTLEEVIDICSIDSRLAPVVDFGHLNARNIGNYFVTRDDYRRIFDEIGDKLGDEYARNLHCHFSKIEYTKAGEKRHLTFADTEFGPAFEPLMEAIAAEGVMPVIICESAGTMAEDALAMKTSYNDFCGR